MCMYMAAENTFLRWPRISRECLNNEGMRGAHTCVLPPPHEVLDAIRRFDEFVEVIACEKHFPRDLTIGPS